MNDSLTIGQHVQLNDLIRRGADRLTPDECGRLLRLWEQHRSDSAEGRRILGSLTAEVRRLTALAADYEQVIRSQRAEITAAAPPSAGR